MTDKTLPAWVETLRRYRMRLAGASGLIHLEPDAEGTWVQWADLVAACPPEERQRLVEKIRAWQADDKQGYDTAIGLLCDAADMLEGK